MTELFYLSGSDGVSSLPDGALETGDPVSAKQFPCSVGASAEFSTESAEIPKQTVQ